MTYRIELDIDIQNTKQAKPESSKALTGKRVNVRTNLLAKRHTRRNLGFNVRWKK